MAQSVKDIDQHLAGLARAALAQLGIEDEPTIQPPPKVEMGYAGFPCFPYARRLGKSPAQVAEMAREVLAARLAEGDPLVESVSAEGPFVNFQLSAAKVLGVALGELRAAPQDFGGKFGHVAGSRPVMVEYSSPNTNKPQHLGHVRNNLLGETLATILGHYGYEVLRVNLINDRGIHICKSMLAYQLFGEGVTPEKAGKKGDHLIGDFYVRFSKEFSSEYAAWLEGDEAAGVFEGWKGSKDGLKAVGAWKKDHRKKGEPEPVPSEDVVRKLFKSDYEDAYFNAQSSLGAQARELLRRWEAGDAEVVGLWRTLNGWVEAGFHATYARMGIRFDHIDHESETYLLGKDLVEEGLGSGVFVRAANGAAVFDLTRIGLQGEKAVLRPDGTSLYTTQDLGTAARRFERHDPAKLIYVVGDEQNMHFQILFGILGALRPALQGRCYHLSYGMVNLPQGRMKSREGTVVDADDLMDEVHKLALERIHEIWKDEEMPAEEAHRRAEVLGLAALKYFLMDYSPQTTMIFNPEQSLELTGRTGVYAMYAYARTAGVLRKGGFDAGARALPSLEVLSHLRHEKEEVLVRALAGFPQAIRRAAEQYDPSKLTEYVWRLAKDLASFYEHCDVIHAEPAELREARLWLVWAANRALWVSLRLLGLEPLEQM
jgi:arginyl-tRNA synthetase